MIEKDNIQELFSKAFENHASPVRPDLWSGVQAKMAAAGATGGAVAAKGISALAKWLIGTAAVTTVGVTAYVVTNSNEADKPAQTTIAAANTTIPTENKTEITQTKTGNSINITPGNNSGIEQTSPVLMNQTPLISDPITSDVDDFSSLYDQNDLRSDKELTDPIITDPSSSKPSTPIKEEPTGVSNPHSENQTANNETVEAKKIAAVKIELPNVFTPNGDNTNDLCKFVAIENVKMVEVTILDADGKTVYKSNDLDFKWDGTIFGGEQAKIGIYTCLISYVDLADVAKNKTAYIYLQR